MSTVAALRQRPPPAPPARRAIAACSIAAVVFLVAARHQSISISAGPLTYFDISFLSSGGATLALAAIGQTIVILSGGFDLSAGAVISLVNVVLGADHGPDGHGSQSCCCGRWPASASAC